MLSLDTRIELADRLGKYMLSDADEWAAAKTKAVLANSWFTTGDIELAAKNIATEFLDKHKLKNWVAEYVFSNSTKTVGIVMAGNIPLVGFHDLLCGFISGHKLLIKTSSKDTVLIRHLADKLYEWEPEVGNHIQFAEQLKGCDAYIATGSNNTARYFEQYFGKYPNIIRKNRTSVAILDGNETGQDFEALAADIFTYFGLGCRNVSQLCVPRGYDFGPLLTSLNKHNSVMEHHKYKNNYDYYLAIYLLNKIPYLTNDSLLLTENNVPFSAVSVLHYRYYDDKSTLAAELNDSEDIQCIVGVGYIPFGLSQLPSLADYADGIDTMAFLAQL